MFNRIAGCSYAREIVSLRGTGMAPLCLWNYGWLKEKAEDLLKVLRSPWGNIIKI